MNNEFCTDCTCYLVENCAAGFTPSVVGNDFCNDGTNNEICNYDGGDCCGYTVNTDFCIDCICHFNETCVAGTHPLVGDGFCNDETNNEICSYDGGDCCGYNINANFCSDCKCYFNETCVAGSHSFCCKSFAIFNLMQFIS